MSFCKKEPERQIRNVLLITIDTLRADALSIYGNKSPALFFEKFAAQSMLFTRAYTTAPITLPAHTSLLTGLYPPSHGVRNNGTFRAPESLELLSETARNNGLATAAFIGAFPLAASFGLNQGFEVYDDAFSKNPDRTSFLYAERSAEEVRRSAEQWFSQNGGKSFFVWMHFFDPHHPYVSHDPGSSIHPYLQEVQYVDGQLDLFFQFLKARNLLSDTLVIITSDHGEAFGEHGEVSHSIFLYNTTLHVPLLISVPGMKAGRNEDVVRLIDIHPTVVDILKWQTGAVVHGRSLLAAIQGGHLEKAESFSETLAPALDFGWSPLFAIQSENAKYVDAPKPEFYNLQDDPGERNNLIGSAPAEEYRRRIRSITQTTAPDATRPALSREEREKLESLGYVASGNQRIAVNDGIDPKDRIQVAKKIAELTMSNLSLPEKAEAYQELIKTEQSNPLLLLRYAEILLRLKRYPQASVIFNKVIDLHYPSAAAYNGLASILFQQDQIDEAQMLLETAVDRKVADGETYYNLAELYFHSGQQAKAFEFYDESIKLQFGPAISRKAELQEMRAQ